MNTSPITTREVPRLSETSTSQTQTIPSETSRAPEAPPDRDQASQSQQGKSDLVAHLLQDNEYMNVEFDDDTKRVVFQSIDRTSGDVVNQYPSEEMLTLVAHFRQTVGVFTDQEI
ncbi:MAG: flagellar protein FlaG [Parvibaculaceae bacterium]|nr:flagellar protein FlaG [Parvibaculaceae bacterium]